MPLNFTGPKTLSAWLRTHPVGQTVLHDATVAMCEGCRHDKRPVLVELHSDGYVHAIGDRCDIHMAIVLHSETVAGELWAQDYMVRNLPVKFRQLVQAANDAEGRAKRRFGGASELCRRRLRSDEIRRLQGLIFLRDTEAWRQRYREEFGAEAIDEIARDVRVTVLG